ncbi:MAG TPA: PadR family transcriptional regulator [Gemmatimonadaceae bacterium]
MIRSDPSAHLPLTPIVLHILLALSEGERHGYAIAQEIESATAGQVRAGPGTMYGSIQRMLTASLIEEAASRTDEDERRRYYHTTALGKAVLALELQRLVEVVAIARTKSLLPSPRGV